MDDKTKILIEKLRKENELLRQEVRTAHEASEITAGLVAEQFEETERLILRYQQRLKELKEEKESLECKSGTEVADILRQALQTARESAELTAELVVGQFEETERITRRFQDVAFQLEIRNAFIRRTFGKHVTDEIAETLLNIPEGTDLGGERKKVTILMSDLRGFSTISEELAPEEVVALLNNYLGVMTEVISRHKGTINEFIGDAILVTFGAPIIRYDDAERAVACALDMQLSMVSVNEWNKEKNLPEIAMGIGINTGTVITGNIGSEQRMKYCSVGSNVNLTSRIESYTVGGQVLISAGTFEEVREIVEVRGMLEVTPKGWANPVMLYDIRGIRGKYNFFLPLREENYAELLEKVKFKYGIVTGKESPDLNLEGTIEAVSGLGARVRIGQRLGLMSNIRLVVISKEGAILPGDIYAKVIDVDQEHHSLYVIRFTSMDSQAEKNLNPLLSH